MAGLKQPAVTFFYRALHAEGLTAGDLARELNTSRPYVCRMVSGEQRTGQKWEELLTFLEERDLSHLVDILDRVELPRRRWSFGRMVTNDVSEEGVAS